MTLVADADRRAVLFVTEGRDASTLERLAEDLKEHNADPLAIESVSIDMSPAFKKGCEQSLPNARITFDKFHVIDHASTAVDRMRRIEHKTEPDLEGLRWTLLKLRDGLSKESQADLDGLIARITTKHTPNLGLPRAPERTAQLQAGQRLEGLSKTLMYQCDAL